MNVVQHGGGRYRIGGFVFVIINLVLCLITAGAWLPIAIIWAICRALGGRGAAVQVVVSNNVGPAPQPYQPPPGYMLVPAPHDAQLLPSPRQIPTATPRRGDSPASLPQEHPK